MNIPEIVKERLDDYRKKNPKYKGYNDGLLLTEIHKLHYPDIDKKEFMKKFNPPLPPPSKREVVEQQKVGLLEEIRSTIGKSPQIDNKELISVMKEMCQKLDTLIAISKKEPVKVSKWRHKIVRDETGLQKEVISVREV